MTKFRAFVKANIHPQNASYNANNNTFTIYIPEHVIYDTKQETLDSKTRWDYSFGCNGKDVVILIRHVTVIDEEYGQVRDMPEFCYDYDTFIKLGGRIEYITRNENIVTIDTVKKEFNELYPNLLNDDKTQIHIEPTDFIVIEDSDFESKKVEIPTPVDHIVKKSYLLKGNNNCNRPIVDESFFKALADFKPDELRSKQCHITNDYVYAYDIDNNNSEIFYDIRMQCVVNGEQWAKNCYEYTVKQKKERKKALEKHGLLDAYESLNIFLKSHNGIRQIYCDASKDWPAPYKIVERNLAYGYKLSGFTIHEDAVIWGITTYERAVKENDCIRGLDICYLMYKNNTTVEVAKQSDYLLMCNKEISDKEMNSDEYVNI